MDRNDVIRGLCELAEYFERRSKHAKAADRPLDIERMNVAAEAAAILMEEEDDGK